MSKIFARLTFTILPLVWLTVGSRPGRAATSSLFSFCIMWRAGTHTYVIMTSDISLS